ncbi:MAG: hypothetical protein JNL97_14755, partial [Verrucomicrobiales bacterium]|nr:hypothetical protein [Verrucomicrobiales bacterium]
MAPDTRGTEKEAARTPRGGGWVVAQSILLVALVASGPAHPGDWHAPAGVAFGVLSFLAAGVLGVAGVARLGAHRSPYPVPKEDSRLVREGVYAFCRHP